MKTRDRYKVLLPMGRPQTFAREADARAYAEEHDGEVVDTQKPAEVADPRKGREEFERVLRAVRDDVPGEIRAALRRRSGGHCEVRLEGCSGRASQPHHRLKRRSGVHTMENLLDVCQNCHTASPAAIHRNVARSIEVGLLIPSWEGPPSEPWSRDRLLP